MMLVSLLLLLTSLAFSTELILKKEKEGVLIIEGGRVVIIDLGRSCLTDTPNFVKVLRRDGRVEVIDLRERSLQSLIDDPDIIYIELPRRLKPLCY